MYLAPILMKVRPILLMLLLAGMAGVLSWMYYAVTRPALRVRSHHGDEVVSDLDACGRRKRVKSAQYDYFAGIAEAEQHPVAAELFRAIALSERVQEQHCAYVIGKLGGHYRPPQRILLLRGTTASNLARGIVRDEGVGDTLYRERIDRHLRLGNRMAARALIWASAAELRQRLLLEACRDNRLTDEHHYLVCPRCGNIYLHTACDRYCPHCLTDSRRFIGR